MNIKLVLIIVLAVLVGMGIGYVLPKNATITDQLSLTKPNTTATTASTADYKKITAISKTEIPSSWNVGVSSEPVYKQGLLEFSDNLNKKISKAALLMLIEKDPICLPDQGACDGNTIQVYAIPSADMDKIIQQRGKGNTYIWSKATVDGKSVDMIELSDKQDKYGETRTAFVPTQEKYGIVIDMIGYDSSNPTTFNHFLATFNPSGWQISN